MDTKIGVGAVADLLGISAPAVRGLADRLGIRPTVTAGGHRRFTPSQVAAMVAAKGIVPAVSGLSRVEVRILAALATHPLGFTSLRSLSRTSGVAPTAAGRALERLERADLVLRADENILDGGAAKPGTRWRLKVGERWGKIAHVVASVVLPVGTPDHAAGVPRRLWHLFWNADPAKLRVDRDAEYIATRMILSGQLEAQGWALAHLPPAALQAAARNRGADKYVKAMVRNALAAA